MSAALPPLPVGFEFPPPSAQVPEGGEWTERDDLLHHYRIAVRARLTDEQQVAWRNDGRKAKFFILGAGQENAQIAAARGLRKGDWMRGYYRTIAEALYAGVLTVREALSQVLGDPAENNDPASRGRQMGYHFASRGVNEAGDPVNAMSQINRGSDMSATGSQMPVAVGLAEASNIFQKLHQEGMNFPALTREGKEITHISIGDGAFSEGAAAEAVDQMVARKLPVVISVYDNERGISVGPEKQGAPPHQKFKGLEVRGLKIIGPVNDWKPLEIRKAYEEAYAYVRETSMPAMVHCKVTRQYGHSASGDQRLSEPEEWIRWQKEHDGIPALRRLLIEKQMANEEELNAIEAEEKALVERAAQEAWEMYYGPILEWAEELKDILERTIASDRYPNVNEIMQKQIREVLGPRMVLNLRSVTALDRGMLIEMAYEVLTQIQIAYDEVPQEVQKFVERIDTDIRQAFASHVYAGGLEGFKEQPWIKPSYEKEFGSDVPAHLIAAGWYTLMKEDPRIVLRAEDGRNLGGVHHRWLGLAGGKGQVIARKRLPESRAEVEKLWQNHPALDHYIGEQGFGEHRIDDWAIAETTLAGWACGAALRGLKPVIECQYFDYLLWMLQQLGDEIASTHWRTGGGQRAGVIVEIHGENLQGMMHAGAPYALLYNMPGLVIAVARNGTQGVGLRRAALQNSNPTVFVDSLMNLNHQREPVPDNLDKIQIPLGHSERIRRGSDITIVTYGRGCALAMEAAEMLEQKGVSVEIIDLQTIKPADLNHIARGSIQKTGRALFLGEDYAGGVDSLLAREILSRPDGAGQPLRYRVGANWDVLSALDHRPAYPSEGRGKPRVMDIIEKVSELMDRSGNAERSGERLTLLPPRDTTVMGTHRKRQA